MKIKITDDTELRDEILSKLKENENYCPCRLEKIPDNKCMCKEFRDQEIGTCHCGLYIKYNEE